MSGLLSSRFGGFLLHRDWFRSGPSTRARAFLSTGRNAVSPRQYVHCTNHICVLLITTVHALKLSLSSPVLCRHMMAQRACATRVVRWHRDQNSAVPAELVV